MGLRCDQCQTDNGDQARFCAKCGSALFLPRDKDPLLGTVIASRFRVVSVLGEGGMGRVYRAEQQMGTTARAVAIKVLTTSPTDTKAVARFNRECETVVSLTHPNTIRFYDFGALPDGRLYVAMELVEGRSLAKAISEGPMPYAVVDRLIVQIGGALAEAHRRGIVHRDLKPDNVLLAHHGDEGEHAKVLDFGIAKNSRATEGEITAAGTIVGTPAYMSPEQLSGKDVDERSDVYALGLIAYEMLTGTRPFVGCSTPLEWATAHLTKTPRPFDDFSSTRTLPVEKRAAILHALEKEPADRTPTVLRFVEELTGTIRTSIPSTSSGERVPPTGDAPTLAARTPRAAVRTDASTPKLPTSTARWVLYGLGALAMTAIGAVVMITFVGGGGPTPSLASSDAGSAAYDAGSDAGPHIEWLRVLTSSQAADSEELALGPPDGRCAVLRPMGKILLELTPGIPTTTADSPAADLEIVVRDGSSGAYRVDVETDRHSDAYTNIGSEIVGSTPIDVDQFDVHAFRYVRVKNPSRTSLVCVDAVGVYTDRPRDGGP